MSLLFPGWIKDLESVISQQIQDRKMGIMIAPESFTIAKVFLYCDIGKESVTNRAISHLCKYRSREFEYLVLKSNLLLRSLKMSKSK
jgi:hypothetical protein